MKRVAFILLVDVELEDDIVGEGRGAVDEEDGTTFGQGAEFLWREEGFELIVFGDEVESCGELAVGGLIVVGGSGEATILDFLNHNKCVFLDAKIGAIEVWRWLC